MISIIFAFRQVDPLFKFNAVNQPNTLSVITLSIITRLGRKKAR